MGAGKGIIDQIIIVEKDERGGMWMMSSWQEGRVEIDEKKSVNELGSYDIS